MFLPSISLWLFITLACFLPLVGISLDIASNNLGVDPIQALHIRLGDWSLRFLWLTLTITPLQTITKWRKMADYRQMLGLVAFFYASLHVIVYILVDHGLDWHLIAVDIIESPYIWLGVLAYLIIFALAISSPKFGKKYLGKNWKKLHRLIYLAAIAVIIHYYWQLKGNLAEPLFYLILILLLFGFRIAVWIKNRQFNRMMIPSTRKIRVKTVQRPLDVKQTDIPSKTMQNELVIEEVDMDD
ncbi:MAG: sulfoxide reductase heme-binding subunit YedZ [Methylococcales bacterium]|nr:MAG: sulfoxide reductase heme-binding subunit YedZ [Methylococcales bacterium]